MDIEYTDEFSYWFNAQTIKSQNQILKRLDILAQTGVPTTYKYLGDGLYEFKWENGRRVYFAIESITQAIILLGGSKNGQDKDIKRARGILEQLHNCDN